MTQTIRTQLVRGLFLCVTLLLCSSLFLTTQLFAQYTAGNIVVLRVGDGTAPLSATANTVSLVEYSPVNGSVVNTLTLPVSVSAPNARLTLSGNSTAEGALSRSADGRYLVLAGYDAAPGTAGIAAATGVNRVVGRIDNARTINTTTTLPQTAAYNGSSIRSAVSNDGTQFWTAGTASTPSLGGVHYTTLGATDGGIQLSSTPTNTRVVNIFDGQLYVSSLTGSFTGVSGVGTGLPTTANQTTTLKVGSTSNNGAYAFVFFDRDPAIAGVDLAYIADQSLGIRKFSFDGNAWLPKGTVSGLVTGLTGKFNSSTNSIDLYVTVGTGAGNTIYKVTDNAAYTSNVTGDATAITAAGTLLATAPPLTVFRGIAFAPEAPIVASPSLTASPTSLTGANGLTYIEGNTPMSTTVSVSGSALTPDGGTITATSSSTAFTVTSATTPTIANSALAPTTYTVQSVTGLTAGTYSATLTFAGGGATAVVPVSATVALPPSLTVTPTSLTNFTTLTGAASAPQTYSLAGNNLVSSISITAPTGFEVSNDGTTFATTATVAPVSGVVSQTLAVRLASSAVAGPFSGTITNISGSATATVAVDGTVLPQPTLLASPTTLSSFTAVQGTASVSQSYTLSALNLSSSLIVTAPTGVEVSSDNSTFSPSLTLPQSTTSAIVFARLTAVSSGAVSGTISNVSGSLSAAVEISGSVAIPASLTANPTTLSGFTTLQGTASSSQSYTLAAVSLSSSLAVTASTGVEISSDNSTFTTSLTFPQSTTSAIVYARINAVTIGAVNGTITNVSGSLTANVAVSGTVSPIVLVPISLTALGSSYTEMFNTLATTGTTNVTLPTGFTLNETGGGARDNELYAADNGSSTTGDTYSYGATGSTERALGSLQSGTLIPVFGAAFTNNTGSTVTSLSITYTGEQWRLGTTGRADQLDFQYSTDATSLVSGTFVDFNALDFSSPITGTVGAIDGNAVASQSAVSGTITGLSIPNGATFWIRFNDFNATGADDGLAVDDFTITPNAGGPVAATIFATPNPVNLNYAVGGGPVSQTVTVTGADLAPDAGNVTVTSSSTAIVVSYNGSPFSNSVSIPYSSSALSSTLAVQLIAGLEAATYSTSLGFVGGGATFNLPVSGIVSLTVGSSIFIHDIQGITHISPLNTKNVANVPGIVTALRSNGFYMQDPNPDADERTSEGIFVFQNAVPTVTIGASVLVSGTVSEFRSGGASGGNNLTGTQINTPTISIVSNGNALPAATILGNGGRTIPTQIIEDQTGDVETGGLTFDPATDGIDFYESLEGMLVTINNPVTSGPTLTNNSIWVLADNGVNATGRTPRGGVAISAGDFNPERILLYSGGGGSFPAISFAGINVNAAISSLTGVMDYFGGDYEVLPTTTATITPSTLAREVSPLVPTTNQLTVATFNVENLDPTDPASKFNNLASRIVNNLRSPDIINLEEIQDNNGATNNGVVDASTTLQTLINAVVAAGGPTYQYRQIDPTNGSDGGEPGGNIRVAFFFNPARVSFVDRAGGTSTAAVSVNNVGGQPQLSFSPGRVDPTNSAFASSRKPLAGEFIFNGQKVFVIANHFNSKGGDQGLYGKTQPPVLSSETQRRNQATIVRDFVSSIQAIDPNASIVVAGDLNDFQFSAPLTILKGSGPTSLTTLVETLPLGEQYTYNFGGNAQVIDHIMVSNGLMSRLDAYDIVHINSEFFDQDSDHDPSVARFTIASALTLVTAATPVSVCAGSTVAVSVTATGGIAPYSYTWTAPAGVTLSGTSTSAVSATVNTSGLQTFTVTVASAGGVPVSTTTVSVSVVAPPTLSITANPSTAIVGGANTTLTASGAATYVWSTGPTSESIVVNTAGVYSVTGTNASGCSAVASVTLTATDLSPTINLPQANFNAGESQNFVVSIFEVGGQPTAMGNIAITITGPVGYSLAFNPTINSIGVQNVSGGTDNVAVGNANWTVTSTLENRQISLVVNAGQFIAAGGASSLGFTLTRTGAGTGSTSNITVNISNDASKTYDGNASNNVYSRIISGI